MERRDFLKIAAVSAGSLFLESCTDFQTEAIPTTEKQELSWIKVVNDWRYPFSFNTNKFYPVADKYNLLLPEDKPVEILVTSDVHSYETDHEIQSHIAIKTDDDSPDVIKISAGRFVEIVKSITSQDPHTIKDELLLSKALSEAVFDGLAELAAEKGTIDISKANEISDIYAQDLIDTEDNYDLIFVEVYLNPPDPHEKLA